MRRKRKKPLPRGKLRDNSKSISVRMTEEQSQRLERYRELTRLPVTTYFRKLIAESEIVERPSRIRFRLYEEVNKIDSNIRQILRNPRAKELDREATDRIRLLLEHICNPGTAKRRGHQDGIQYVGPLRRRIHPPHLHPRHQTEAGRSSGNHGQLHGAGHVSTKEQKIQGRKAELPALCFLNLSTHFDVWVTVWVKPFSGYKRGAHL